MAKRRRRGGTGISIQRGKRKNTAKTVFLSIFAVICLAGLIFLGYSVGKPIIEYLNTPSAQRGDPWVRPEPITEAEPTLTQTEPPEQTTAAPNMLTERFSAIEISSSDMLSAETLRAVLANAKNQGYSAAVLPLKEQGGLLNYASSASLAKFAGENVRSELTAKELADTVTASGLIPIAQINLLNDNNRYDKLGIYKNSDGSTWLDNSAEKGGKPWLSPFETDTQTYFSELSAEISAAGFSYIICDGLEFPLFRNSDLNYIGESVKDANRYKALISSVNTVRNSAADGTEVAAEMSARKILDGTEEAFRPEDLSDTVVAVKFSMSEIGNSIRYNGKEVVLSDMTVSERVNAVYSAVRELAPNAKIMPYIDQSDLTSGEVGEAVSAVVGLGYKNYIVS